MPDDRSRLETDGRRGFVKAGSVDEIARLGRLVIRGRRHPILVLHHQGRIAAVDNRCPHQGFPLHRGSVADGILTCHWHHARFDIASGCTFDPWADDLPTAEVEVLDGIVWVADLCRYPDGEAHWRNRLKDGLASSLGLVLGKAILGLTSEGEPPASTVREAALFGATHRDGWDVGLTVLTALGSLAPALAEEDRFLALLEGARRVAADCLGQPPRRRRRGLDPEVGAPKPLDLERLERWLSHWTRVRHREAAERTVLTAVSRGAGPAELAALLAAALTERRFADGGHTLDFANKAFECLDLIGWDHAETILPTLVKPLVEAEGAEETDSWRHPVDLPPLIAACLERLEPLCRVARSEGWDGHAALAEAVLGEDPAAILSAIERAASSGATPVDLARSVAYAAALRVARFGIANEFSDWDTAHHAFTYANATHRLIRRIGTEGFRTIAFAPKALRAILDGAMTVWLARFLNVPPTPLPGERGESLGDLPADADGLIEAFLAALDRQSQVGLAARLVGRYVDLGHDPDRLAATLAHAVLREDAGFHAVQMLEAALAQSADWGPGPHGRAILVAAARFIAAHAPTERSRLQTARIALRLQHGLPLHEEAESGT